MIVTSLISLVRNYLDVSDTILFLPFIMTLPFGYLIDRINIFGEPSRDTSPIMVILSPTFAVFFVQPIWLK